MKITCSIVAGFENEIKGLRLKDLKKFANITTCENPLGVHALCQVAAESVLAAPHIQQGSVAVTHYVDCVLQPNKSIVIKAHDGRISQLALSKNGNMLATSSAKGTVIRFFDTLSGNKVYEVRRGSEPAEIQHLHFENTQSKYLVCTSNKDTVHVFKVNASQEDKEKDPGNTKSYFSLLSYVIPSAGDSWSYAQVKLPARVV